MLKDNRRRYGGSWEAFFWSRWRFLLEYVGLVEVWIRPTCTNLASVEQDCMM